MVSLDGGSVPHNGVSLDGDCMTYSVGFRAPTQRDLLLSMATFAQEQLLQDEYETLMASPRCSQHVLTA